MDSSSGLLRVQYPKAVMRVNIFESQGTNRELEDAFLHGKPLISDPLNWQTIELLMAKEKITQFAKMLGEHPNEWVALKVKEQRIIATGKTLKEVQRQVAEKKEKDYVFHLVPSKPLAMYEI
jgi:hypothetical protein